MSSLFQRLSVNIPYTYIEIIAASVFGYEQVADPGDSFLEPDSIVHWQISEMARSDTLDRAGHPPKTKPLFISARKLLCMAPSVLVRAAYGNTKEHLLRSAISNESDQFVDPTARAMIGWSANAHAHR